MISMGSVSDPIKSTPMCISLMEDLFKRTFVKFAGFYNNHKLNKFGEIFLGYHSSGKQKAVQAFLRGEIFGNFSLR